jgi:hypothetical protein
MMVVLKYNRHAEFFATVIFGSQQMVLWSGIQRAYSQLKHVLAQAGGRNDSLLQAPHRIGGAFFSLASDEGTRELAEARKHY